MCPTVQPEKNRKSKWLKHSLSVVDIEELDDYVLLLSRLSSRKVTLRKFLQLWVTKPFLSLFASFSVGRISILISVIWSLQQPCGRKEMYSSSISDEETEVREAKRFACGFTDRWWVVDLGSGARPPASQPVFFCCPSVFRPWGPSCWGDQPPSSSLREKPSPPGAGIMGAGTLGNNLPHSYRKNQKQ